MEITNDNQGKENKGFIIGNTLIILAGDRKCSKCDEQADVSMQLFYDMPLNLIDEDEKILFCFNCLNKWKAEMKVGRERYRNS